MFWFGNNYYFYDDSDQNIRGLEKLFLLLCDKLKMIKRIKNESTSIFRKNLRN